MRWSTPGLVAATVAGAMLTAFTASAQDRSLSGPARDTYLAALDGPSIRGETPPLPDNASALDAALARADYPALRAQMGGDPAQPVRMLNWTKAAVYRGAAFQVVFFYAADLWTMADVQERAAARDPRAAAAGLDLEARWLKTRSLIMALYAQTLITVDGQRCSDPQAWTQHAADLDQALAAQWAFGRSLSVDERQQALDQARRIEQATAPVREPDLWLCAGEAAGRDVSVVDNTTWWSRVDAARDEARAASARRIGAGA